VVITDAADNVGGGTPGDTPTLLRGLLAHRKSLAPGLVLVHMPDAAVMSLLEGVNIGDVVANIKIGGRIDTQWGPPVVLESATLVTKTDGPIRNCAIDGEFGGTGPTVETGRLACLALDNLRVVISEKPIIGPHQSVFTHVGLDPFAPTTKVVGLKSGTGWEVTYKGKVNGMIRSDCPGPMSYSIASYPWKEMRRPIFPLDMDVEWSPKQLTSEGPTDSTDETDTADSDTQFTVVCAFLVMFVLNNRRAGQAAVPLAEAQPE
jgi:microcystin degradation protein MlrC